MGDTLSMEFREVLHTPAHYMYGWGSRLKEKEEGKCGEKSKNVEQVHKPKPEASQLKSGQISFDF